MNTQYTLYERLNPMMKRVFNEIDILLLLFDSGNKLKILEALVDKYRGLK